MKKSHKMLAVILIVGMLSFLGLATLGNLFVSALVNNEPLIEEHAKSDSALPKEATDISSYIKNFSDRYYEFKISEQGFFKWAMKNKWDMHRSSQFEMHRYDFMAKEIIAWNLSNCYCCRTPPRGNGGGTWVAYDIAAGRAYFYESPW